MDAAVGLAVEPAGGGAPLVLEGRKEEVNLEDLVALDELLAGFLKVELDEKRAEELGQRVGELVRLLFDRVEDGGAEELFAAEAGGGSDVDAALEVGLLGQHDGGDEVAQEPRGVGLDGGEEAGEVGLLVSVVSAAEGGDGSLAHPSVHQLGAALGVVEVDEERPVEPPGALLETLGGGEVGHVGGGELRVDVLAHDLKLVERGVPGSVEGVGHQFAPHGRGFEVWVGGEDSEVVEEVGGGSVLAHAELESAEFVEHIDLFKGELQSQGRERCPSFLLGQKRFGGRSQGLTLCCCLRNCKFCCLSCFKAWKTSGTVMMSMTFCACPSSVLRASSILPSRSLQSVPEISNW